MATSFFPYEGFLEVLRENGFSVGVDSYMRVQALVQRMDSNLESERLKFLMCPLFAQNEKEQKKFYRLYENYFQLLEQHMDKLAQGLVEETSEEEVVHTRKPFFRIKWTQVLRWGFALLSVLLSLYLVYLLRETYFTMKGDQNREGAFEYLQKYELNKNQDYVIHLLRYLKNDLLGQAQVCDSLQQSDFVAGAATRHSSGGYELVFLNRSIDSLSSRIWTFGDSSDISTDFSPTHVFADTGTYVVSLQVENQHGCKVFVSKLVKVEEPQACWAGFSYFIDPSNDRLLHFTDSSLVQEGDEILSWTWYLGDDRNTIARGATASIEYPAYRPYKICLNIRTQEGHQDSLCKVIRLENPMKSESMLPLDHAPMYFVDITQLSSPNTLFLWLLLAVFLMVGGIFYEIYRQARRRLIKGRPRASLGPFTWALQSRDLPRIYGSSLLHKVATHLRQRQESNQRILDLDGTIKETIEAGGYPNFRFQAGSRPSEYLVLIEQRSGGDHQARLFQNLMEQLSGQDVYVDQFFFRSNPQVVYKDGEETPIYLYDLKTKYPDHRLVIFGDGEGLIDPVSGEFQGSLFELLNWDDRAILTPVPPADWGFQEISLARQMLILPATTNSLFVLLDEFDEEGISIKSWRTTTAPSAIDIEEEQDPQTLRAYLGEEVFRWLAACAVYPELHWCLTLSIGQALEKGANQLVTEKHLLRLVRLPYFRSSGIPDSLRLALVDSLDQDTVQEVRSVILNLLEKNPPPEGSIAHERQQRQMVSQQWELAQGNWANRRRIREQMEAWVEREEIEDIVVLRDLGRKRSMKIPGKGAPHWSKWMFRHGMPLLGMKSWLRLGGVLLIFAMIVTPLYREKVTWNNLVEFRQWLRNPGNVVLINNQYYRLADSQDSARYFSYLGGERYQLGDYGSAYNQFKAATELVPFEQLYRYQLGLASYQLTRKNPDREEWKLAYGQFALANALSPGYSSTTQLQLARTWEQQGLTASTISPSGRWVALAYDKEVQLLDWKMDTLHKQWVAPQTIVDLNFSTDGQLLLQTEGPKAALYLCATGERAGELDDHSLHINSTSFSPDGQYVLTGSDDLAAVVWNRDSRRPFHVLEDIHFGAVTDATFSPGGEFIVTASDDSSAVVWELISGEFYAELIGQNEPLRMAQFFPDNQTILTASESGKLYLWSKEGEPLDSAHIQAEDLYQLCLSPDYSAMISFQRDQTSGTDGLYVWDIFADRLIQQYPLEQLARPLPPMGRNERNDYGESLPVTLRLDQAGKSLLVGIPEWGALLFTIERQQEDSLKFNSRYNQSLVAYHQQGFAEAYDGFTELLLPPNSDKNASIWYARGLTGLYVTLGKGNTTDTASFHRAIQDFSQALQLDTAILSKIGSLIPFFHEVYNIAPEEYVVYRSALCELLTQYQQDACVIFDFDEIRSFREGRAAVRLGDKWGFIDTLQHLIISPQYDHVDDYVHGMSFVTNQRGRLEILDLMGNSVFSGVGIPSEGLVAVRDRTSALWGYLEMKSHLLVIGSLYELASPFKLGYAKVKKGEKYGFIDITGDEDPYGGIVYDEIKGEFGLSKILLASKEGKTIKIVYQAPEDRVAEVSQESFRLEEMNSPFMMDGESNVPDEVSIVGPESNGRIRAIQGGKYGYLRPAIQEMFQIPYAVQGEPEVIIGFQYEHALDFSYDRAAVKLLGGKWGYIDPSGKEVIPFVFDKADYFVKEGEQIKARVSRDGQQYEIELMGNCLDSDRYPCRMELLGDRTTSQEEYIDKESGLIGFVWQGQWGLMTHEGDTLITPQYDNGIHFVEGLAKISKNGKWGFLNSNGQVVIPLEYEEAQDFSEGLAAVKKGDKWGYIDTENQAQITFDYDQAKPFRRGKAIVTQKGRSSKINEKGDKAANRIK
ncbi:MAG: WG repeat-containing protein [Bacteroidota bacterium]